MSIFFPNEHKIVLSEYKEGVIVFVIATVYQMAKPMNLKEVLDALKNLAEELGIPDGLDGWERLLQRIEERNE